MIAVHLLRHAHAGDPERWTDDDSLRPLSEKGRRQCERLGRLLAGLDEAPDLFITSPKVRAVQTAELVAEAPFEGAVDAYRFRVISIRQMDQDQRAIRAFAQWIDGDSPHGGLQCPIDVGAVKQVRGEILEGA